MGVMVLSPEMSVDRQGEHAADQESLFRAFRDGKTYSADHIGDLLTEAGVEQPLVESVSYGYFRKVVARVRIAHGDCCFAKVALHPYAVRLLAREAEGLRVARTRPLWGIDVPTFDFRKLSAERAVCLLQPLHGAPLSSASALRVPDVPFRSAGGREPLDDYLDRLFQALPEGAEAEGVRDMVDRLAQRAGVDTVPIAPAHGDFVYWNVLRRDDGGVSVLDFEDYRSTCIAGYDAFYWCTLPLTRFAVRRGLVAFQAATVKPFARRIWKTILRRAPVRPAANRSGIACLALGLTLAEHSAQMLREHELADIRALIGDEAMTLRCAVISQYRRLLEGLAR